MRARFVSTAVVVACVVLAGSLLASCSRDEGEDAVAVVVDTDMGFDDARALMLLIAQDGVDLRAVTVAGTGLARCPTGAANAKALLDVLGAPDTPVACGQPEALEGERAAPDAWRDAADALSGMDLPPPGEFGDDTAVEVLVDVLGGSDDPVVVLTLGPLTNLALALDADPSLVEHIDEVVMMGGAFDVPGNMVGSGDPPVAEFNIWFDPLAAATVLSSGVEITMVPLDATNDVPLTRAFHDAFADGGAGAAAELIRGYNDEHPLFPGLFHWDDLAAATLLEPGLVELTTRRVSVITDVGTTIGQTVDDSAGTDVKVAVAADRAAFEALFYESFGVDQPAS